jgi:hypothetical protein
MGKPGSKSSPSACIRRIDHLRGKQSRGKMKPPYHCPICDTPGAVKLVSEEQHPDPDRTKNSHGTTTFTFACRKGCFNETVELKSLNYEPIDGFNAVVDELHHAGKAL